MDSTQEKLAELLSSLEGQDGGTVSRATSPGGMNMLGMTDQNKEVGRNKPRTYPYFRYLPYRVEDEDERQENLQEIFKHLYIAIEAGDFAIGAIHWTKELRNWLSLKFDPTKEQRRMLAQLYYEIALAPGVEIAAAERFANMFMILVK